MKPEKIRQKALEDLGNWLKEKIKEENKVSYMFFRSFGFRAIDALQAAREITQKRVNESIKANFYGRSPF